MRNVVSFKICWELSYGKLISRVFEVKIEKFENNYDWANSSEESRYYSWYLVFPYSFLAKVNPSSEHEGGISVHSHVSDVSFISFGVHLSTLTCFFSTRSVGRRRFHCSKLDNEKVYSREHNDIPMFNNVMYSNLHILHENYEVQKKNNKY